MRSGFNSPAVLGTVALAALLSLSGCKEDPASPGTALVKPKTGSLYIFSRVRFDTTGAPIGTPGSDTMRVTGNGVTIGAHTDLTAFLNPDNRLFWVRYESNGDMTILDSTSNSSSGASLRVQTMPFASKTGAETDRDTSSNGSDNYTVHLDSLVYAGTESVTVPAGTFSTMKVTHLMDHRTFNPQGTQVSRIRELLTYYFAPSVGFFVQMTNQHEFFNPDGTSRLPKLVSRHQLSSYTLK